MALGIALNDVETIDLTVSPPPVRIDLSEDTDLDLSQDEIILVSTRASVPSRPNQSIHITTYSGPPSSIVSTITNRSGSKRPAETIVLDDDAPPSKRARDMSVPVLSNLALQAKPPPTVRRTSVKREVIELDSDGEQSVPGQQKKLKREKTVDSDGGSDYDCIHAGYDLADSRIWKPIPANEDKVEQGFIEGFQKLTVSAAPPQRRYVDISDRSVLKRTVTHPMFIWEQLRQVPLFAKSYPRNAVHQSLIPPGSHGRKTGRRTTIPQFRCLATFKDAPGSINKIVQSGSWVGICSAVSDGHPDESNEREDHYNREGSVMVWNGAVQTLPGHCRDQGHYTKHYTVNDIKPNPTSLSFVSSGNDKRVRVWIREPDDHIFSLDQEWQFKYVPHDLAFKPGDGVLAVAERRIHVYSEASADGTRLSLPLFANQIDHCVGAMAWGIEITSNLLFASSEPPAENDLRGYHKAFDIGKEKMAYQFDAQEAGDTISISPDGTKLALFTRGNERTHLLRMYDIARGLYNDGILVPLKPFPSNIEGEVNSATFSPDGIHLALGRNDNHTHIYDSRMLDKLLFDFEHCGPSRVSPGSESYGVVQTQWVGSGSRRLPAGLYTGGNDGCVRFWDPLRSAKDPINGRVLVESSFDIGCFSIGDYHSGERDVIVGDCAGEVSVFELSYWGA